MGESHALGGRLANAQKCIRTQDIDEVGDNRHLTFFEMMGNWSLGNYFKREAIEWSFEFLTDVLKIDPKEVERYEAWDRFVRDFFNDCSASIEVWNSVKSLYYLSFQRYIDDIISSITTNKDQESQPT